MNSGLRKWLTCLSILFTVFTFSGAAPDYKISQRCATKSELRVVFREYKNIAAYRDLSTLANKCVLYGTSDLKFSLLAYSRMVDVKSRNNLIECDTYSVHDRPITKSYAPRNFSDVKFNHTRG